SKSLRAFPVEHLHQPLHVPPLNICPEGRDVRAPGIPERSRKQGEHEHAERDVSKRQPGRGEVEKPDHMRSGSVRLAPPAILSKVFFSANKRDSARLRVSIWKRPPQKSGMVSSRSLNKCQNCCSVPCTAVGAAV